MTVRVLVVSSGMTSRAATIVGQAIEMKHQRQDAFRYILVASCIPRHNDLLTGKFQVRAALRRGTSISRYGWDARKSCVVPRDKPHGRLSVYL